jgi:hypothetical protein
MHKEQQVHSTEQSTIRVSSWLAQISAGIEPVILLVSRRKKVRDFNSPYCVGKVPSKLLPRTFSSTRLDKEASSTGRDPSS